MDKRLTILITPLDWGLGHATRCVPLINELNAMGHRVIIAASGSGFTYLQLVFPNVEIIRLREYAIKYFKNAFLTYLYNALNIPLRIWQDRKALSEILKKYDVDLIISDNRFGFYSNYIPSVFVTHQLNIQHPIKLFKWLINKLNKFIIKKYDEIWVVDDQKLDFAGKLSAENIQSRIVYIGLLPSIEAKISNEESIQYLLILSGPEPMKSIWLNGVCQKFFDSGMQLNIVGEAANVDGRYQNIEGIKFYGQLSGQDLADCISRSEYIISRSGYSTLMDLSGFGKKLILIPTPHQPEQIYLANYFQEKGWAISIAQDEFTKVEIGILIQMIVVMPKFIREESLKLILEKRLKKLV
ncbi:MAG: hypothetical protein IPO14_00855 [Saprospiraceae bacterium]|jgi:uncharacterized protein (TIGR00661 family)|nr:hypothetical protein [Saprospiraceae bacterium]